MTMSHASKLSQLCQVKWAVRERASERGEEENTRVSFQVQLSHNFSRLSLKENLLAG